MNTPPNETHDSMIESLSKNITVLCEAIDPKATHGPEAVKIAAHAKAIREVATHLCNVIDVMIGIKPNSPWQDIQGYRDQLRALLES